MTDNQNNPPPRDNVQYVAISPDMLQTHNNPDDEIDLRELWNVIWAGKWIIIAVTAVFTIGSVFYALSLPNIYRSEALLAPANEEQQGGLGGLAGQFGGLASLAGVNLGGGGLDKTALAIEIIKSREFVAKFAEKYNVLPDLMAVKKWDSANNKIIYNEKVFLSETGEWLREVSPPREAKPSMQEAYSVFRGKLNINQDTDTGMIKISIEHLSPYIAKIWVDLLIQEINFVMKMRDSFEAINSITYLQSQILKTVISEHETLLYQLIEEQTKTLMFTEVRKEYVFKTIDPAIVQENRYKPNRRFIVFLAIFLGLFVGVILVFIRYLLRK